MDIDWNRFWYLSTHWDRVWIPVVAGLFLSILKIYDVSRRNETQIERLEDRIYEIQEKMEDLMRIVNR
jgi:hypothetical protein